MTITVLFQTKQLTKLIDYVLSNPAVETGGWMRLEWIGPNVAVVREVYEQANDKSAGGVKVGFQANSNASWHKHEGFTSPSFIDRHQLIDVDINCQLEADYPGDVALSAIVSTRKADDDLRTKISFWYPLINIDLDFKEIDDSKFHLYDIPLKPEFEVGVALGTVYDNGHYAICTLKDYVDYKRIVNPLIAGIFKVCNSDSMELYPNELLLIAHFFKKTRKERFVFMRFAKNRMIPFEIRVNSDKINVKLTRARWRLVV